MLYISCGCTHLTHVSIAFYGTLAHSVDPDQTPQNVMSDHGILQNVMF